MSSLIESLNAGSGRWIAFGAALGVQTCFLFALLFALDLLLRRRVRASLRHAFWVLFLVKLVLPPSLSFPTGAGYWLAASQAAPLAPVATALVRTQTGSEFTPLPYTSSVPTDSLRRAPRAGPVLRPSAWILLAWLAGASGLVVYFGRRLAQLRRIVAHSVPAPASVQSLLEGGRAQLGLRGLVHIRLSDDVRSPALCGLRRPVVLLPSTLADKLGPSQLHAVVLHELIHLQRGDLWIQSLQALLQIVYWWHPLVWAANIRIRLAREEAVDDRVMRELGVEGEAYPATLLELAKAALPIRFAGLSLLGILDVGGGLRGRIRRLLESAPPVRPRLGWTGLIWTLLLGVLVLPMRGQVRPFSPALPEPDPAVTRSLEALDSAILDRLPTQAVLQRSGFSQRPQVVGGCLYSPGRIMGRKQTSRELLAIAYESRPSRVTPSAPLPEGTFDFIVSLPQPPVEVLRGLLRDRLGLTAVRSPTRMNALVLTLVKPTAALQASVSAPPDPSLTYEADRVIFKASTLGTLGSFLEHYLDQPVVDETQSTQPYDFVLHWERAETPAAREKLKQAVEEQFGLALTAGQRELDAVVVGNNATKQQERAATNPAPKVVAAVYDALYDSQHGSRDPKPVLGQAEVEVVLGPSDGSKGLVLDQAVKILRTAGYVPGSIIGLDGWFMEHYGKTGAQMIENASLVIAGRSNSLHGVVDFYEPPAADQARRADINRLHQPLASEHERLRELLNRFTEIHPSVIQQRQRIRELEARSRSRAFHVDPDLFLRNLQLRRGETIRAASDNPMDIFLDLLKGAGVDCTNPSQHFFNRETGTIILWNSAEGLAAAERVILGLNQPDGRPSSYAPPAGTNPSILAEATILQVTDADFTRLRLGEPPEVAQQIGDFWHLGSADWNVVRNRARDAGLAVLTRPRIQTSPGITARLFIGGPQEGGTFPGISLETVPYLSGEQLEMSLLVQTTGHFSRAQRADWPDARGWTNVALHGRVVLNEGDGVVLRAHHPGPNPTNNLVVLFSARVLPQP